MEKRLIDANNAISVLKILSDKCCDDNSFEQAISVLESVPTIDAVEVVRCKDCKRWNECGFGMRDSQCHCSWIDYWTNADFFCANGELKEENEELEWKDCTGLDMGYDPFLGCYTDNC